MHLGFLLALVLELFAVAGVFVEIPFVSNYAFWVAIAAYVILASSVIGARSVYYGFALVLALLAVVGVFVEIPFVSNYAFWIAIAAFVILASSLVIFSVTITKK
jgi:hypothetical protein